MDIFPPCAQALQGRGPRRGLEGDGPRKVSRFPGAEGRIPNFAGASLAAEKLTEHRLWRRAQTIKANPDSPQTHGRRAALEEGKTVIMAVPRLRDPHPFRVLDPKKLSKQALKEAATIKGALKHGRVVAVEELPEIDFVLCGSVAVNLSGARVGKGGGYSDLEYGILIDAGKIDNHTTVATTVHPTQILRRHLMMTSHDLPIDLIATPRAVIESSASTSGRAASSGTTCSRRRSARSPCWNGWATPEPLARAVCADRPIPVRQSVRQCGRLRGTDVQTPAP